MSRSSQHVPHPAGGMDVNVHVSERSNVLREEDKATKNNRTVAGNS